MAVAVSLLDDLVQRLQAKHRDVPHYVVESIALEGYRSRTLTTEEVRQLLGLEDRRAVHAFLQAHNVPFSTLEDLCADLATLDRLHPQ